MREGREDNYSVCFFWNSDSSCDRLSKLGEAPVLTNWSVAINSPERPKSESKES